MKKRLVISYDNLTPELKEEVKAQHPNGFNDSMMRIDKGADDFFYAIVLETEEINYLIKIDVKIDDKVDDDDHFDDDEIKDTDDLISTGDEQFGEEN
ncbi:MAG: hypothetical protein R3Y15_04840 [Rikenellaceae bacterium]